MSNLDRQRRKQVGAPLMGVMLIVGLGIYGLALRRGTLVELAEPGASAEPEPAPA